MDRVGLVNDTFALVRAGDSDQWSAVIAGGNMSWFVQAPSRCTIKDLFAKGGLFFKHGKHNSQNFDGIFAFAVQIVGVELSCLQS